MGALPRLRGPAHDAAAPGEPPRNQRLALDRPETLTQELAVTPDHYTPWLALEWATLQGEYGDALPKALGAP